MAIFPWAKESGRTIRIAMMESLTAFKRAGADGVLSYFAPMAAEKLKSHT